ncbi:MAG TPA: hypothetical protein VHC69_15075 [Polyangiaceae bacterium]|nr:hypothetical protein [Polyangiaceae bacterium]
MSSLVSCAACRRHIRRSEATCPFCGVGVTSEVAGAPEPMMPPGRLSRAALMAFAAAAVGTTACSSAPAPMYGLAETGGFTNENGGTGSGGAANSGGASAVALYGAPAAGFANAGGAVNAGGTAGTAGTNAGGKTASGGTTNEADAGDGGPASGGVSGAGGATFAPLYGAPAPHYGVPPKN